MGTLLDNTVAPLWVWIVVIVVGSLLLIGTVMAVMMCRVRKHRTKSNIDLESSGLTRRVTLKNGKLVEQDNHVSLTGSHFGLMSDHDPICLASPATARGSSPFDWWAAIRERSASRQSQRSQDTASGLDSSASAANGVYYDMGASLARLSLTSLNEKTTARSTTSLSDVSTSSKPLIAITTESRREHTVNFSRPQPHRIFTSTSRNQRLSIINETTPRNSFLSISSLRARIASWASSSNGHDQVENAKTGRILDAEKDVGADLNYFYISEKTPNLLSSSEPSSTGSEISRVSSPQILPTASRPRSRSSSPADYSLQHSTVLFDAPTPELPSRHPSRRSMFANTSEPPVLTTFSRSSSANNVARKPMLTISHHSRTKSATNFSRKPPITDNSQSSPMKGFSFTINFSRPANVDDNSTPTSNMSWFEVPAAKATLSEPFDMPTGGRDSRVSIWSLEAEEPTSQHQTSQSPATPASTAERLEPARSLPGTVALETQPTFLHISAREQDLEHEEAQPPNPEVSSETEKEAAKRRSRGRSTDGEKQRSRCPIRARSVSKGRNVLRKRSLQRPEVHTIESVDPASF